MLSEAAGKAKRCSERAEFVATVTWPMGASDGEGAGDGDGEVSTTGRAANKNNSIGSSLHLDETPIPARGDHWGVPSSVVIVTLP